MTINMHNNNVDKNDIYIYHLVGSTEQTKIAYGASKNFDADSEISKRKICQVKNTEITGYLLEIGTSTINPKWHSLIPLGPSNLKVNLGNALECDRIRFATS